MKTDRTHPKDEPTLLARSLMRELFEIAALRKVSGARVDYRLNAKGEHVVAIIFPSQPT